MRKLVLLISTLAFALSLVACENKSDQLLSFRQITIDAASLESNVFLYVDSMLLVKKLKDASFGASLDGYNDEFFDNKALIIFTYNLTSSEHNIKVDNIKTSNNNLIVNLVFNKLGDFYTEDYGARTFIIELDKIAISEIHIFPYNTANRKYESYYYGQGVVFGKTEI